MHTALAALFEANQISVAVVDVDTDPVLVEQFDELVPVLIGHRADGSSCQLCHYFLDVSRVEAFFSEEMQFAQLVPLPPVAHLGE